MTKEDKVFDIDHYKGIKVEEYNGVYGLLAMQKGSGVNEVWYKQWAYPSRFKNGKPMPEEKSRPVAVRLGDRQTALKVLRELWEYISNQK